MRSIRNANVAVVGGAGFLGSHLVSYLIEERNCQVLVIDNLVAGRREFIHKEAMFEYHDITGSESRLRYLLTGFQFVMNYSAWPYIVDSFSRPIHVNDVNFMGAMKVINAAQEAGAEAILQVSSAEIYGGVHRSTNELDRPPQISETDPIISHSSYGVAKAAVDNWVQVRWREAKTPCIALRQFNCIGERETHPYIVPEIISQLAKQWRGNNQWEHEVNCRVEEGPDIPNIATVHLGNNSFRDFLYAGDAVKIAVELLERGEFGQVYNLGSETGIKMYDLAALIGKVMGFERVEVIKDESRVRPWEIWHLQSDNSKIRGMYTPMELLNRTPWTIPLEEAIRRTVKWYESNGRRWPWESSDRAV